MILSFQDRKKLCQGRLLILAAALFWSLGGSFTKSIGLPGPLMACGRVLFAALFLLPLVPRKAMRFRWPMVAMTISFSVMNLAFVSATVLTTSANAIFLQYTAPVWMVLGCVVLLKEPFDRKSFRSLAVSLVGIAVIVFGSRGEAAGVALALLSGIAYAGVALSLRALRDESVMWLTFLNHLLSGLALLPVVWHWYPDLVVGLSGQQAISLAMFGVLQMAVPYLLFARGLKSVSPQEAGLIALVEPVLNPVLTFFTNGEIPSTATIVGGSLILAAVLLRYSKSLLGRRHGPSRENKRTE